MSLSQGASAGILRRLDPALRVQILDCPATPEDIGSYEESGFDGLTPGGSPAATFKARGAARAVAWAAASAKSVSPRQKGSGPKVADSGTGMSGTVAAPNRSSGIGRPRQKLRGSAVSGWGGSSGGLGFGGVGGALPGQAQDPLPPPPPTP